MRREESGSAHTVPRTATQARDHVRALIEPCGSGDQVLTDALLVTSELATNAIRHGGGIVGFSASVSPEGLRLAIADASGDAPVTMAREPGTVPLGGFGWPLICRLTRKVAISRLPAGGKSIEVLIPLDGPARPAGEAPDRS
ncbi:hypothetical protein AMK16_20755 [Streptomyces sp. CB00455]|uniref:ATP-binding protein n=1 Tax=Streptomyces sp. CB00455 TaxID=1703927 RepID=UPI00093A7B76|nr:ATP-binding protein [Streptomyces sp. CB00455]OKK17297.1 hypothetical protein AMK16_20755 [Streptomyces sp. CB00455]